MIPVEWLRWGIIIFCFLVSVVFIEEAFFLEFRQVELVKNVTVLTTIGVFHFVLALVYKLYFFREIQHSSPQPAPPAPSS